MEWLPYHWAVEALDIHVANAERDGYLGALAEAALVLHHANAQVVHGACVGGASCDLAVRSGGGGGG